MKIYCFTNTSELDKYIGRNVWVKVYQSHTFMACPVLYMKLLSKENDTYTVLTLNPDIVEGDRYCRDLRFVFGGETAQYPADKLLLMKPVEVLTDEDVADINETNTKNYY